jgi:hypothetical protein
MYVHHDVYTFLKLDIHVCTWYVHDVYIQSYKHVCTWFSRVCTSICMYICIFNHMINMYIQLGNVQTCICRVFVADILCTDGPSILSTTTCHLLALAPRAGGRATGSAWAAGGSTPPAAAVAPQCCRVVGVAASAAASVAA